MKMNLEVKIAGAGRESLLSRMALLRVKEEEFEEQFTHSSGPGGQNVNKTSTAVILTHRPTGLQVRCEKERSQFRNRMLAKEMLLDKLEQRHLSQIQEERARVEKLRRQKRPRSWSAQERVLRNKAKQSLKKKFRQKLKEE